jgi:hypothetical protein
VTRRASFARPARITPLSAWRRVALLAAFAVVSLCFAPRVDAQTARRPTACDSCIAGWYYFDEEPSGGIEDWSCASSSYDGHRGSDFSLAGGNGAIDTGYDLVAVADGTVISAEDGHFDHCRTCDSAVDARCGTGFGGGFANHVAIDHGGYRAWYAHMRTGSVRVAVGDRVTCGEVIGQIGSSGCTTGAHVHFEPRPPTGGYLTAFDPFAGACSPRATSLWTTQGPHRGLPGPECDGSPPLPTCPAGTYDIWTCNTERTQRRRCIGGAGMIETCAYGCVSMPTGVDDVCATPPDADGDGARADVDCNDGDAAIRPGATELCGDGVDQDCVDGDASCSAVDMGTVVVQDGATPIPVDGATPIPVDGAIRPLDGGVPAMDGAVPRGSSRALEGGCGCRVAPTAPRSASAALLAAMSAWLWLSRRARRRRSTRR